MEILTLVVRILEYLILAGALIYVIVRLIKAYLRNEELRRKFSEEQEIKKNVFPLKVQACERLVLFLERLRPENLVLRVNMPGMIAGQLQVKLLKVIREEYEHNLTQQVYVSPFAWSLVKASKEHLTKIVNQSADMITPNTTPEDFAKIILEKNLSSGTNVVDEAIRQLKIEMME
ncbi:MAG: hypothetical protein ACEPOW_07245 [Bacteroidales bacterium]